MDELLDTLGHNEGPLAYFILALSAGLEYVFPPFPGDTVTLFGAFLITARGWNAVGVMSAVTVGSLLGALVDYAIGVGLARRREPRTWLGRYWQGLIPRLEPLIEKLRQKGAFYIVINRFLPGIRALFFVAAGMAGLSLRSVLSWGAVSALAWNALIIAAGASVGASWDRLLALFQMYSRVTWIMVAVLIVGAIVWHLSKRLRTSKGGS